MPGLLGAVGAGADQSGGVDDVRLGGWRMLVGEQALVWV